MATINNLPTYAKEYSVIVATYIDGEYWFYGAYDTDTEASRVAFEVGGEVIYDF